MLNITICLKYGTIHIFHDVLTSLGKPKRISLLMDSNAKTLIIVPHDTKDFKSHNVLSGVYSGNSQMRICSKKLCKIITESNGWEFGCSYTVPGRVIEDGRAVRFRFLDAIPIENKD